MAEKKSSSAIRATVSRIGPSPPEHSGYAMKCTRLSAQYEFQSFLNAKTLEEEAISLDLQAMLGACQPRPAMPVKSLDATTGLCSLK